MSLVQMFKENVLRRRWFGPQLYFFGEKKMSLHGLLNLFFFVFQNQGL